MQGHDDQCRDRGILGDKPMLQIHPQDPQYSDCAGWKLQQYKMATTARNSVALQSSNAAAAAPVGFNLPFARPKDGYLMVSFHNNSASE
jgi:hypothetical protein